MKLLGKLFLLALVALAAFPMVGCGVGSTPAELRLQANRVVDYDARMMVDDLTLFAQLRRPHRASRFIID